MRADGVKVHFEEARGRAPADAELRATVKSLERPVFAYSYEIIDNRQRQRRRPRPEGRGPDDVPDGEERRARAARTRRRRTCATCRARACSSTRALRHLEHDAGRHAHASRSRSTSSQQLADPEAKVRARRSATTTCARRSTRRCASRSPIRMTVAASGGSPARAGERARTCANEPDADGRVFARLPRGGAARGARDRQRVREAGARRRPVRVRQERPTWSRAARRPRRSRSRTRWAHAPPAVELPQPQLATRDTHTQVHGDGERRRAPARRLHLRRLAQGLLPVEPQRGRPEADGVRRRPAAPAGRERGDGRRAREPRHDDAAHVHRAARRPERRAAAPRRRRTTSSARRRRPTTTERTDHVLA